MKLVQMDTLTDKDGKPLVTFCGAHYPQELALAIAAEVFTLLDAGVFRQRPSPVRFCCPHCHKESDFSIAVKQEKQ